jgi:type VI secretion system secreted protein VgrG
MNQQLEAREHIQAVVDFRVRMHGDPDANFWLAGGRFTEAVSELCASELEVLTDAPSTEPAALLDTRITVELARSLAPGTGETSAARRLHGIIWRVEDAGRSIENMQALRVFVAPELWFLSRRRNSRIFHHLTSVDIVQRVLADAGLYAGDSLSLMLDPLEPYRVREYCVQYQETDLAFIERLLEEEGIAFYFEHDQKDDREVLVLADAAKGALSGALTEVPTASGDGRIPWIDADLERNQPHETITHLERRAEIQSTAVVLHDHDFTNATLRASVRTTRRGDGRSRELEVYEHPGRYVLVDFEDERQSPMTAAAAALSRLSGTNVAPAPRYDSHSGDRLAAMRFEELRAKDLVLRGRSNVAGLGAGRTFALVDGSTFEDAGPFVVLRVEHAMHSGLAPRRSEQSGPPYANAFVCMPRSAPYRPPRKTARPIVPGPQTATVVGEPGDEVRTDYYGRIKVELHWDRARACESQCRGAGDVTGDVERDPHALLWVRVAQAWAGPGWGTMFIPRVGMEVIVTFLDGDPDRPLVVGCVYNSANVPPYALPGEHPKATIRTHSTPSTAKPPGRVGFNELRFDDSANREQIYLHAERDLKEKVRNHHETLVLGSQDNEVRVHQHNRVGGSQVEQIRCDQVHAIGGAQTLHVGHARNVTVLGTERYHKGGGQTNDITGFGTHLVRGLHLHAVTPSSLPSPESLAHIAAVNQHVAAILDARARGIALDPYLGVGLPLNPDEEAVDGHETQRFEVGEGATDEWPRHGRDWSDYGAPVDAERLDAFMDGPGGGAFDGTDEVPDGEPAPEEENLKIEPAHYLETYVVEGRRLKAVGDHEDVVLHSRVTTVAHDDHTGVTHDYTLTAGAKIAMSVHGTQLGVAQGLTLRHEPAQVDLFLGGDGLRMNSDRLQLKRKRSMLTADDSELKLGAADGTVDIYLLGDEDSMWGMSLLDHGNQLVLSTQTESNIDMTENVTIYAKEKLTLSNDDETAKIVLTTDGKIEITADEIILKGQVKTE